jgi:Domain of unknown function (DUF6265)
MRALLFVLLAATPLFAQEKLTENTLAAPAGAPRPKATLADMKWLAGHWTGTALGGFVEEIWSEPRGGAMMGMYRHLEGDQPTFYEFLTLVEVGGSLSLRLKHFNPDHTSWEEKAQVREFPLIAIRDGVYHFEGMAFRPEGDTVTVWLAIGSKDKGVREEVFRYRRERPDPPRK